MITNIKNSLSLFFADKFRRYLTLSLIILGILILLFQNTGEQLELENDLIIHYFYSPTCPYCREQAKFNEILQEDYPQLKWIKHDITDPKELQLLKQAASDLNLNPGQYGIPFTLIGKEYNIGFSSQETTGVKLRESIQRLLEDSQEKTQQPTSTTVPLLGEIDAKSKSYSLPVLAILLGLIDGFNPCAMWVLVYLISIVLLLNDKRKIWLLVGTFVLASGILYFLFMTAWLNVFLLMGFFRPLTLLIGLFALGAGIISLGDYIKTKGALICKIELDNRKKTMSKIQQLINSPLTLMTLIGIIVLAFVVNSIEFVCSAAIPAVFTQILAISNLNTLQHYSYILLYDIFFMLDDLIIFSLAAFAISKTIGTKYASHTKLIGAIIMILLGVILAFFPHTLR